MAIDPLELARHFIAPSEDASQWRVKLDAATSEIDWKVGEWRTWFQVMASLPEPLGDERLRGAETIVRLATEWLSQASDSWDLELITAIGQWYHRSPHDRLRSLLLALLAASGLRPSLEAFAALVVYSPPESAAAVAVAFQPLFRHPDAARMLFPRLLDALTHRSVAAAILDLANYLARSGAVTDHPARGRQAVLVKLLGQLARRLECLEEQRVETESAFRDVARQVAEATSVAISLCDALALMDAEEAIPKLYPLLTVRHRRLQVEAAAALTRLGDETGKRKLIELAEEPVVRLYAVQFARELDCFEEIPEEHRSDEALVIGRAALALSQPTHFGVPPTRLELLDRRRLPWPGYDEPIEAALVRYAYSTEQGEWSNIACLGPHVATCAADLGDLPPDDIYSVFAGMETAHEEIRHWEPSEWTEYHRAELARLERRLLDRGYHQIEPRLLACFFGDWLLVARTLRGATPGIAVVDAEAARWFPTTGPRSLDVSELFALYKGRRLLRAFGSDDEAGQSGSDGI